MKILFLTHSFNSLTQRLYIELTQLGHEISIEFDINDAVTLQAVALYQPALIIAPFLKRAIPEEVWRKTICFIVHPGVVGDRGSSALDWAIMQGRQEWGVTILQANEEMDAGDIWASETFLMRQASKSSLYRHEVVEAAIRAVLTAVVRCQSGKFKPQPVDYSQPEVQGRQHEAIRQVDRQIDWENDHAATILKKIRAADGSPGVLDTLCGSAYYLYDACVEDVLRGDQPGEIIAKRHGAICRATIDGAIWIGHLKHKVVGAPSFKLSATLALKAHLDAVPEVPLGVFAIYHGQTYRDIWFVQKGEIGYLHFNFYNGAMGTEQCERLRDAYVAASHRDVRVIVLMGGSDFWSNGIHLNHIEHAASPADESWRNINAMNDLAQAIITTNKQFTIAAIQGNAGAGGVFLSLATDYVYARDNVMLNPHYKSMGNLYGSEYWTYLLPRRVGKLKAETLTQNRLPISASQARDIGLIDDCFSLNPSDFKKKIEQLAQALTQDPSYVIHLHQKVCQRQQAEQKKSLQSYRDEELRYMQLNFYGFDPSYHVARYRFVHKIPHAWTPRYLARHRYL
ncbi:MAG: hydrogenase maturation protein [Nitrosomonas sp.]|nr:hydrogenase maturation protein [Nitrosomonas sp.]